MMRCGHRGTPDRGAVGGGGDDCRPARAGSVLFSPSGDRSVVETADGVINALAYVIDRDPDQYCGGLGLEEQATIVAQAKGGRGSNRDWTTATHLADLGIGDADLEWLGMRVCQLT